MAGFVLNYILVVKVTGLAAWKRVDSLEVQLYEGPFLPIEANGKKKGHTPAPIKANGKKKGSFLHQ